jgi:hypothetical protein
MTKLDQLPIPVKILLACLTCAGIVTAVVGLFMLMG